MPTNHARPPAPSRWPCAVAAFVLAAVLLGACGDQQVVKIGADDVISHPPGDSLVLQVRRVGGLNPQRVFAEVPPVTVLGGGTVVTQGAQVAIFPPPLLPPLFQVQLSEEGLQALLAAADEAGLTSPPPDYGVPTIADAPNTVITVHAKGKQVTHEIPALFEAVGVGPGLTERQARLRQAVSRFVAALNPPERGLVPPEEVSEAKPFEAERFAIRARPVQPGEDEPVEGIEPEVLEWSLPEVDLRQAANCLVVEREQAKGVAEVATGANTLSRFRQDGVIYTLALRPLVPPEQGCEAVVAD